MFARHCHHFKKCADPRCYPCTSFDRLKLLAQDSDIALHPAARSFIGDHMTKAIHALPGLPEMGFIRLPHVLQIASFSRATLWRRCSAGTFPKPVRLSANISAWRVEDVRAWVEVQGRTNGVDAAQVANKTIAKGWCVHE